MSKKVSVEVNVNRVFPTLFVSLLFTMAIAFSVVSWHAAQPGNPNFPAFLLFIVVAMDVLMSFLVMAPYHASKRYGIGVIGSCLLLTHLIVGLGVGFTARIVFGPLVI